MGHAGIRVGIVLAWAALSGCTVTPTPTVQAGDLERTRSMVASLGPFVDPVPLRENYLQALVGALEVRAREEKLTVALFKPKGWFCYHGVKDAGMTAPSGLRDPSDATRLVAVDRGGRPLYQVSCTPWTYMTLLDADGDRDTTELVLWSERCEYSDPAFLKIFRLSSAGCRPLLELILNPAATRTRIEIETVTVNGETVYQPRQRYGPERRGRWRFLGNSILIEEMKPESVFETVARFEFDPDSDSWRGPPGSAQDLWQLGGEPWIQSSFVSFGELSPGEKLTGAAFGSLRKDVDHLKAAEEAAREAGLK
jgi:hypothetical protein